ncbi:MAG: CDP-diacylglycerol--serine O-phosphatidyltransferase, partial [Verrucomicrobiota bacterium]
MPTPASATPPNGDNLDARLKIYFLPNLLTAGNLFCGFVALTKIVEANLTPSPEGVVDWGPIKLALAFILLACIFDLFDGRVARMGGVESPFGREFDSLADLISFGVAPAFLVHRVVLGEVFESHPQIGWFIASIYLLCGAFRLARFNCLSTMAGGGGGKEFLGFPIPSAAGLVASLTLLIVHLNENERGLGHWKYVPVAVLVFLSAMMVSTVRYPNFKSLGLRSTST